jgi:hypothetical protein
MNKGIIKYLIAVVIVFFTLGVCAWAQENPGNTPVEEGQVTQENPGNPPETQPQEEPPLQEEPNVETNTPPEEEPQAQPEPVPQVEELRLGKIYFPKDFVHAGQDFLKGNYLVSLITKEGISYFRVSSASGETLFEELAVVKPYKTGTRKFKTIIRRGLLKSGEYFRLKVIKPGEVAIAFFLVKPPAAPAAATDKTEKMDKAPY